MNPSFSVVCRQRIGEVAWLLCQFTYIIQNTVCRYNVIQILTFILLLLCTMKLPVQQFSRNMERNKVRRTVAIYNLYLSISTLLLHCYSINISLTKQTDDTSDQPEISSSSDELLQSRLVVKAGGYECLVNLLAGETNLSQLLEWYQVFPAGLLLGVVECCHVLAGLHTEALLN